LARGGENQGTDVWFYCVKRKRGSLGPADEVGVRSEKKKEGFNGGHGGKTGVRVAPRVQILKTSRCPGGVFLGRALEEKHQLGGEEASPPKKSGTL